MTTPLVLDCLDMALCTRRREGAVGFAGLTHHTDAGSVYTSISFTDRLVNEGIDPSVGSVGDAYDNSLAESVNAALKRELLEGRPAFPDQATAYRAVFRWVNRYNTQRRHSAIGQITPNAYEATTSATLAEAA